MGSCYWWVGTLVTPSAFGESKETKGFPDDLTNQSCIYINPEGTRWAGEPLKHRFLEGSARKDSKLWTPIHLVLLIPSGTCLTDLDVSCHHSKPNFQRKMWASQLLVIIQKHKKHNWGQQLPLERRCRRDTPGDWVLNMMLQVMSEVRLIRG